VPIIGLDVSAKGLEPISLFFLKMPPDSGSDFKRVLQSKCFSQNALYANVFGYIEKA
jgi:hypothetical protein